MAKHNTWIFEKLNIQNGQGHHVFQNIVFAVLISVGPLQLNIGGPLQTDLGRK